MSKALTFVVIVLILLTSAFSQERKEAVRQRTAETKSVSRARTQDDTRNESRQKKSDQKPRKEKVRSKDPSRVKPENETEEVSQDRSDNVLDSGRDSRSDEQGESARSSGRSAEDHRKLFDKVKDGLSSGRVSSFSDLLGPQVHVTLRGGESGYYSSSQAYYLLEKYLHTNRLSGLEFNTIGESGTTPYASGKGGISDKGGSEGAQVYVSLSQVGERWLISQIKIY
jgi:hypothetical protein